MNTKVLFEISTFIVTEVRNICDFGRKIFLRKYQWSNKYFLINFALQIHSNLSKTKIKFDFGYIWKMFIGGSFTKCKSEIPILIHVFPILLNKKAPIFVFLVISTNKNYHGIEKN